MPEADPGLARVGLDIAEGIHRQPEPIRRNLFVGRLMALAVALRANAQLNRAVARKRHFSAFLRRPARRLQKTRNAKSPKFAPRLRISAPGGESIPIREPDNIVDIRLETPTVEGQALRRIIGKLYHRVFPAQLNRVDAKLPRGSLDEAFRDVVCFGLAGTSVCIDRCSIRKDTERFRVNMRYDITSAHRSQRRPRGGTRRRT